MSLNRLIFYGAIIGGWAAFVGWMFAEILLLRGQREDPGLFLVILIGALVGAGIGGGLSMLGGVANAQWRQMLKRLGPGLIGGLIGGAFGALLGDGFVRLTDGSIIGYILGWTLLGLAIGAVDGIYERSPLKLRNGLIGGAVGGFLGGLMFLPFSGMGGMAGRATSFVILGMCIGLFIAVVQVALKDAWLTVVDGFRPGRQLIITEAETFMGTAEQIALPFIAFGARGVEPRHVRIVRQPDGTYLVHDNNTRSGTKLNGQPLTAPAVLRDGDVIAFGVNAVRFSERRRGAGAAPAPVPAAVPIARAFQAAPPGTPVVTPVAIQPVQPIPVRRAPPPAAPPTAPIRPAPPAGMPPSAAPSRPVPPAAPRPLAPQPPAAAPPRPAPPRQAAPQPPPAPRPPAAPPQGTRPAPGADICPNCGARVAGQPGKRFCMICETTF